VESVERHSTWGNSIRRVDQTFRVLWDCNFAKLEWSFTSRDESESFWLSYGRGFCLSGRIGESTLGVLKLNFDWVRADNLGEFRNFFSVL
jgi:hypothetical protein